jgi:potassium-transporting ATPase potassium-binding subunit
MTVAGWVEIVLFLAVLTALTAPVGAYMARVYRGEMTYLGFVERPLMRMLGQREARGQDWKAYAKSVLVFSLLFWLLLYLILRTQTLHPWNPLGLTSTTWDNAFNTASSFVTNTNWQYYGGETTMTYFSQMAGLAVQNFVSAGVAIAVVVALIRGLAARSSRELGNFYSDLVKSILYVLLPLSVVAGLVLVSQGALQTLGDYRDVHTITGLTQTLARGPVASQESIKELGTNGGGFFNVNSAMPFENPTWFSNFFEMLLILVIPAGLTATYGRMVGNRRQGWTVFGAMMALFVVAIVVVYVAESKSTPAMDAAGVHGINLEGKEQRFGLSSSALFVAATTAASCGAVNAAMESLSGLGGVVPLSQMSTGEVIFGGVGSGLYGMLMFFILGVFISGLMVGRTPEFLGKKIESREVKLTIFATIGVPLIVLATTALAIATSYGRQSIYNSGPQGFGESLYAYVSQANNNGSAFAGYTAYTQADANVHVATITFSQVLGGLAMLGGRFLPILAVLAVAGSLAGKRVAPLGAGTLRTDTPTFAVVVIGVVVVVALLTFVPAFLLAPIVQALTHTLY